MKEKHKNKNKNKNRNKKVLNYKPIFTPREHPATSPIHTFPPTDITTFTENTQLRFKQHNSIATTQYTQPTHKIHSSTCTKLQLQQQYATVFPCQSYTYHTLKCTYTHAPSTIIYRSADYPHPHPCCNQSAMSYTIPSNS